MNIYCDEDGFEYGDFTPIRIEMQRPITFERWLCDTGNHCIDATSALTAQLHLITLKMTGRATKSSWGKAKGKLQQVSDRQRLIEQYHIEVQPVPTLVIPLENTTSYHATMRIAIKRNKRFDLERNLGYNEAVD